MCVLHCTHTETLRAQSPVSAQFHSLAEVLENDGGVYQLHQGHRWDSLFTGLTLLPFILREECVCVFEGGGQDLQFISTVPKITLVVKNAVKQLVLYA